MTDLALTRAAAAFLAFVVVQGASMLPMSVWKTTSSELPRPRTQRSHHDRASLLVINGSIVLFAISARGPDGTCVVSDDAEGGLDESTCTILADLDEKLEW